MVEDISGIMAKWRFEQDEQEFLTNPYHVMTEVFALIAEERRRQDAKWGAEQNHSGPEWSAILGEEYGEACQQVLRFHFSAFNSDAHVDSYDKLREELVQVAAVAVAWLERL